MICATVARTQESVTCSVLAPYFRAALAHGLRWLVCRGGDDVRSDSESGGVKIVKDSVLTLNRPAPILLSSNTDNRPGGTRYLQRRKNEHNSESDRSDGKHLSRERPTQSPRRSLECRRESLDGDSGQGGGSAADRRWRGAEKSLQRQSLIRGAEQLRIAPEPRQRVRTLRAQQIHLRALHRLVIPNKYDHEKIHDSPTQYRWHGAAPSSGVSAPLALGHRLLDLGHGCAVPVVQKRHRALARVRICARLSPVRQMQKSLLGQGKNPNSRIDCDGAALLAVPRQANFRVSARPRQSCVGNRICGAEPQLSGMGAQAPIPAPLKCQTPKTSKVAQHCPLANGPTPKSSSASHGSGRLRMSARPKAPRSRRGCSRSVTARAVTPNNRSDYGAVAGAGWWVCAGQHEREIQSSSRAQGANAQSSDSRP